MNVTLNTYNHQNLKYNQFSKKSQSFTAANPVKQTAEVAQKLVNEKSSFFKPFLDVYDSITDKIASGFTSKVIDSKLMNGLADKFKNSNNLFQHCLTMGSAITSGLYMQKTLTNDKLDKDRKQTLAVNQGLTFAVSTAGAYMLDKYLKTWWEDVTAKYVGLQTNNSTLLKDFKDLKAVTDDINKGLKKDKNADAYKLAESAKKARNVSETTAEFVKRSLLKAAEEGEGTIKSVSKLGLDKFIDKLVKDGKMNKLDFELSSSIKGMGALRTMLVFGFVYRYFVPVVVTKPANWLCEKYLANKKSRAQKVA